MTKKDFFRIVIKLFGLYALILSIFTYIPFNLGYVTYQFQPIALLWIFGVLALIILIFVLLIRKTDLIINFLKIDKGFDDDRIELGNFNNQKIIKLALILIGGFLIIDYLPRFLQYTYLAFKKEVTVNGLNHLEEFNFGETKDYLDWGISVMNLIGGYVLLTNYDRIAKWITRKEKNVG